MNALVVWPICPVDAHRPLLEADGRLRQRCGPVPADPSGHFDAFDYIELCRKHYAEVGIGADFVESLLR